jgi:hypothetical protein
MKALRPVSAIERSFSMQLLYSTLILTGILTAVALVTTGCGSSGAAKTPPLSGNTNVTVMVTGTANDQLSEFDVAFQGITLTSQSGKTATLLSLPTSGPPSGAEFMHINGVAEPLVTASIPQDVYTSATVTPGVQADFVCISLGQVDGQQTLATAQFNDGVPASAVTVALASPLTVTGASMALSLDLVVSQSASVGNCLTPDGFYGYALTPTFNLTPLNLSASPTNSANGKVAGLDGQITAIGTGNSFTLSIPDVEGSRPLAVSSNDGAVYQGISGFSALAVGTFVDMDGAIQPDGSLLATRVAVEDPSAGDVFRGPLIEVAPSVSVFTMHAHEWQGEGVLGLGGGSIDLNFGSSIFQISGQFTNLASLPFAPSFNAANMVPGQEVYASLASFSFDSSRPPATTMTLMPQIIDGTVTASTQSGNFTDYTVTLAPYDLFPLLAVQPGQTTVENNPSQIEVYVDSNTQLLNTVADLAPNNTLRFYGIVFNDNGTLRMDCAQVNDGVSFTPAPNANSHLRVGSVQTLKRTSPGGLPEVNTTVIQTH